MTLNGLRVIIMINKRRTINIRYNKPHGKSLTEAGF